MKGVAADEVDQNIVAADEKVRKVFLLHIILPKRSASQEHA